MTANSSEASLPWTALACIPLRSVFIKLMTFSVHPNLLSTSQSPFSWHCIKGFYEVYEDSLHFLFLFCALLLNLSETENHVHGASVVPKSTLGLRQDMWSNLIIQSVESYVSHNLSSNWQKWNSSVIVTFFPAPLQYFYILYISKNEKRDFF